MGTHIAANPGFSVEIYLHFSIKNLLKKKKMSSTNLYYSPCPRSLIITGFVNLGFRIIKIMLIDV